MFLSIVLFVSCQEGKNDTDSKIAEGKIIKDSFESISYDEQLKMIKENTPENHILSNDIHFINDSILKGKFELDILKYELESAKKKCYPIRIEKKIFDEFYNEGFENLGDLNGDKKNDSVFVLHALNYCENGDSYYFTDNKIPRILTESNCCHPKSIFSIGDIDEDGGNEIAEYYSSCSSRYKKINIWTLKENKWELVASCAYTLNDNYKPFEDFEKLFKKISKNKFKFLEISDINVKGELVKEWITVTMK